MNQVIDPTELDTEEEIREETEGSMANREGVVAPPATERRRIVKLTVNLPSSDVDTLGRLARKYDTTRTNALRMCIATQRFLEDEREDGGRLLIQKGNEAREIVFR